MRYVLIDRITALVPGQSLAAIKNVSFADDLVTHYAPGLSALPAAMVLEAMAQAAGSFGSRFPVVSEKCGASRGTTSGAMPTALRGHG